MILEQSDGSFCDVYTRVDMPSGEAQRPECIYQERILASE